jgi:hypothetical protein
MHEPLRDRAAQAFGNLGEDVEPRDPDPLFDAMERR